MDTRTCQCQFDGEETLCIASFIWSQAHLRLYISWEMQRREDWTWSYSTSTISQDTQPSEDIQSCFAGWCPAALCRACCQAERTEDPAWVCHYEGFNCEDVTCEQDVNLGASQRIERGLKECDWQSFSAFRLSEASRPLHMHRRWSALNTEVWVQPHCTQCLWCYGLNIPCWSCCFQTWIRAVWWVKSYLGFSIKWIDRASRYLVSVGFGSSLQICTLCLPRWVWFVVAVAKDNSIQ